MYFLSKEAGGEVMKRVKNVNDKVKIRISGLSNGLHEYHFSAEPTVIGLENNFQQPVEIDAQLDKATHQIYLKADVQTSGNFQCDRCLDDFAQELSASYRVFYMYNNNEGAKFPPEEIQFVTSDTIDIDLTDDVCQMVLLSVPLKLLCTEECKGLCPHCGSNWNHNLCDCKEEIGDPRLQGLQDLLHN